MYIPTGNRGCCTKYDVCSKGVVFVGGRGPSNRRRSFSVQGTIIRMLLEALHVQALITLIRDTWSDSLHCIVGKRCSHVCSPKIAWHQRLFALMASTFICTEICDCLSKDRYANCEHLETTLQETHALIICPITGQLSHRGKRHGLANIVPRVSCEETFINVDRVEKVHGNAILRKHAVNFLSRTYGNLRQPHAVSNVNLPLHFLSSVRFVLQTR